MVLKGFKALLGSQAVQQLRLMSNIMFVSGDSSDMLSVLVDYKDVFKGEGRLEEMLHLTLDKTVFPMILPVRKLPFAVKEPLTKETDRLASQQNSQAS